MSQLSRFQQIQNSLARTVVKAPRFCHITSIICSLHWLRIIERIQYKLPSLTYIVLTTTQPPYLHSHFCSTSSQYSLFIRRYSCSATVIIFSENYCSLFSVCFTVPLESTAFISSSILFYPFPTHLFLHPSFLPLLIHHSAHP